MSEQCRAKWQLNDAVQCDRDEGHSGDHEKHYPYGDGRGNVKFHWIGNPEPAEPVIEVAPGEPHEHCDYCFTVKPCVLEDSSGRMMCQDCLDKAAASTGAPAVPAQEAPRAAGICGKSGTVGYQQVRCTRLRGHDHLCAQLTPDGLYAVDFVPAEPQAGAQELFPGANDMRAPTGMENLRDTPPIVYEGNMAFAQFVGVIEEAEQAGAQVPSRDYKEMWLKAVDHGLAQHIIKVRENTKLREELGRVNTHLNSIRNYATEAAKTPITRESILAAPQVDEAPIPENLKMAYGMYKKSGLGGPAELIERIAQLEAENRARKLTQLTQSDEMQGFCRLVLSEIGGGL